jgi:hypothetical protein
MKKSTIKIYTDDYGNYYVEGLDGNLILINAVKTITYDEFIKNNENADVMELLCVKNYYLKGGQKK